MAKKQFSGDVEKSRRWLEDHKDVHLLNGKPIVETEKSAFEGYVPQELYNQALLYISPWGNHKQGISEMGIMAIARTGVPEDIETIPNLGSTEDTRLFRSSITLATLNILEGILANLGIELTRNQKAVLVLEKFVGDPLVVEQYHRYIGNLMRNSGSSQNQLEDKIFSHYRLFGSRKRLELLEAGKIEEGMAEKLD